MRGGARGDGRRAFGRGAMFLGLAAVMIAAACGPAGRTLEPRLGTAAVGGSGGTAPPGGGPSLAGAGGSSPSAAGTGGSSPSAAGAGGGGADCGSGGAAGASSGCTVPGCGAGGDLPRGINLTGVWIGPEGEVWAVGGAFVGRRAPRTAQWCWCAPGAPSDFLVDVWGATGDDVFAVGLGGLVLRFDGTRWVADVPVPVGISRVHGSAPDNVWLVGPGGWTARFDGSAWQAAVIDPKYNLSAVWVAPDGVVRVAGGARLPPGKTGVSYTNEAVVLRHPGDAGGDWTVEASFKMRGTAEFYGLSGSSATDIWAVGNAVDAGAATSAEGFIAHFDGSSWSGVPTTPNNLLETSSVVDVAPATPDAGATWFVWRSGVRFDGPSWTTTPALANTSAIDARGDAMYAVGGAGL